MALGTINCSYPSTPKLVIRNAPGSHSSRSTYRTRKPKRARTSKVLSSPASKIPSTTSSCTVAPFGASASTREGRGFMMETEISAHHGAGTHDLVHRGDGRRLVE